MLPLGSREAAEKEGPRKGRAQRRKGPQKERPAKARAQKRKGPEQEGATKGKAYKRKGPEKKNLTMLMRRLHVYKFGARIKAPQQQLHPCGACFAQFVFEGEAVYCQRASC